MRLISTRDGFGTSKRTFAGFRIDGELLYATGSQLLAYSSTSVIGSDVGCF